VVLKVHIKLYGTLSRSVDGYDHQSGLDLSIAQEKDATIKTMGDLLVFLNLEPEGIGMMFMDDAPVSFDTRLKHGARIRIFQPIFGG
jgi:sulfur carrier protein ThiS